MSDTDRDDVEISAIADMTTAEVRAGLRRFGLRPFECLPPGLSCLRAPEKSRPSATFRLVEKPEETQRVVAVMPDRETARKNSGGVSVWAVMRWQFQWFKSGWGTFAFRRVTVLSVVVLFVAFLAGIMLEPRVTANHPEEPTVAIEVGPDSAYSKVALINFTANEELRVRETMASLFTSRCTEAFAKDGLRSPLEVAMHEGVVILPAKDLYKDSAKHLGLASEETRRAYWEEFSSGRAQSGTVPSTRNGVQLTTDGRARVFLHETAFLGKSVIFERLSLHDVLAHEFIHVGGQPSTSGWYFQHDLAGFEHYDEIMGTCR